MECVRVGRGNLKVTEHEFSEAVEKRQRQLPPTPTSRDPHQQLIPSMTPSESSFKSCASEMRSSRIPVITSRASFSGTSGIIRRSRSTLPPSPGCKTTPLGTSGLRSRSSLRSIDGREYTPLRVIAQVREPVGQKGYSEVGRVKRWLPLEAGEKVKILSIRGPWSRCCRLHSRHGVIMNGVVPTRTLDLIE